MSRGIFISATGTDVGKTFVSALIVKKLRESGLSAGYYKPALSGATLENGKLMAGDAHYVCSISNIKDEPNSLISYIYQTPVSPHLAAAIEGNPVELDVIREDFETAKKKFDFITVEGCGGIICPIRMDEKVIMLTDIIRMLDLDIILVCPAELGTINHTVLTAEYALRTGIRIRGIIMNGFDEKSFLHNDNKKQIEYLTKIPVIACISKGAGSIEIDRDILMNMYREV